MALGEHESKEAVSALIAALKDEDEEIRIYAARALGSIGDESATDALMEALENDKSAKVRREAARALSEIM